MKEVAKMSIAFIVGIIVVALVGCGNLFDLPVVLDNGNSQNPSTDVNLNWTVDDFSSNFAKAAFLTVKVAADSLELMQTAGVDFNAVQRSVAATNSGLRFEDLGSYVADISSRARSAGTRINLEDEIALMAENYAAEISGLILPPDAALASELIAIEDGDILLVGGLRIPIDSLEGIATIEIMNRVAAGEDLEDVIMEIQADIAKIFTSESAAARGLYMIPQNTVSVAEFLNGARWHGGLIRYRFTNEVLQFEEKYKITARSAMAEWQTATDNKVRFEEITPTVWDSITKAIGQSQFVTFVLNDDKNDSTVGSVAGSRIRVKKNASYEIYLHEIGHTLGLMHEHQRHDRDNFVTIDSVRLSNKVDYGKVPEKTLVAGLISTKILFVTVYLPYIWHVDYGKIVKADSTDFDYDSIMMYGTSAGVNRKTPLDDGTTSITVKTTLSETDIKTVKSMY